MSVSFKNVLLVVIVGLLAPACATPELDMAFEGKMESAESSKVISKYCITCHNHREFDPVSHVFDVKYRYKDKKYAGKTECRTCHTYSKNWLRDVRRGTNRPLKH